MVVLVTLAWWSAVGLNVAVWTVWAILAGWAFRRFPADAFLNDGRVLRLRPFEATGRWYERRLRIKSWKDHLPETGGHFGGMSKRRLPGRGTADLQRFSAECRRGERTHWTIMAGAPPFALWNPFEMVMFTALGVAGNLPFIAVLRYNRARVTSILQRA